MTISTSTEMNSTILWVRADSNNALDAMAAIERALRGDLTAIAVPPGSAAASSEGDTYLSDNLALAHHNWSVDPHRIVISDRPYAGWAINRFQHLVRRTTWWFTVPQWLQINGFHGAVVRILDVLTTQNRQLLERIGALEGHLRVGQTDMLEHQLYNLRSEHHELLHRIAALEAQLERRNGSATAEQSER